MDVNSERQTPFPERKILIYWYVFFRCIIFFLNFSNNLSIKYLSFLKGSSGPYWITSEKRIIDLSK